MDKTDWAALVILLCFCFIGKPAPKKHRRQRAIIAISLFMGLYLCTWNIFPYPLNRVTGHWIIPFRSYALYSVPAPDRYFYAQSVMVTQNGNEYPIDLRVWQPFIPRYFNILLRKTLDADEKTQQLVGKVLMEKTKAALKTYHAKGKFDSPNARLLGSLHYPSHQTPKQFWKPGTRLPKPEEIAAIRVYRISWVATERQKNSSNYQKNIVYEFHYEVPYRPL